MMCSFIRYKSICIQIIGEIVACDMKCIFFNVLLSVKQLTRILVTVANVQIAKSLRLINE